MERANVHGSTPIGHAYQRAEDGAGRRPTVHVERHHSERPRSVLHLVEIFTLSLGIVLLGVYGAARIQGEVSSNAEIRKFQLAKTAHQSADSSTFPEAGHPASTLTTEAEPDTSLWSESRIQAYQESLPQAPGVPLAILHIPAIKLSVPVLPGTDSLTLNRGVGHISGTTAPGEVGNIGIAGHRDGFFRGLKDLQVGDRIQLETMSGDLSYVVQDLMVVEPHEVEVLDPTITPTLTLVTCYPFYFVGHAPRRFVVAARAESTRSQHHSALDQIPSPEHHR